MWASICRSLQKIAKFTPWLPDRYVSKTVETMYSIDFASYIHTYLQ